MLNQRDGAVCGANFFPIIHLEVVNSVDFKYTFFKFVFLFYGPLPSSTKNEMC